MIKSQFIRSMVLAPLVVFATVLKAQALSGKVTDSETGDPLAGAQVFVKGTFVGTTTDCLLYTSPSPRDATLSRMPSSA